jgi:parvulin-like peptidyl-prolyl isomerase
VDEPTEAEIAAHFEAHKDEYQKGERVLAQHILISPDGDTETSKNEARDKIEAIRTRVLGGKAFADEAAAHSMCPSGKDGGSLGWFSRGMMVPEFDQAVFAMKDGEVASHRDAVRLPHHYKRPTKTRGEPDFDASRTDPRPPSARPSRRTMTDLCGRAETKAKSME